MTSTVVHDSFTIEHFYPALPERVFAAFADPAAKAQWFGPPGGAGRRTSDFRVGGQEVLEVTTPDGRTFVYTSTYQDIVEGRRIVHSYDMTVDGRRTSVSVATIEMLAHDGGTRLRLTEQGAYLDGLDDNAARREGTEQFCQALGRFLTEVSA